jgi:ABC-type nitrate/sulfonate/bicarbonate transport system substrate-binding protein
MSSQQAKGGKSRRLKHLRLAAVTTAVAVAAVGCGSGAATQTTSTGGQQSGNGSKDLGTIKVVVSNKYDLAEPGVDAGLKYGAWQGTGLKVKQIIGEHGTNTLAAGGADITVGSPNRTIGPVLQGLPVKLIGPTLKKWDQYVIVSNKGKYADAKKPADLKGAKFGISSFGSAGQYSTVKLADQQGWSKNQYSTVTLGSLDGLIAGLKKGTIDAFAWSAITAYTMEKKGIGHVVGSMADIVQPPAPLDVLVASNKVIKQRPKAVKAFCEGYYKAQRRLKANPKQTLNLLVNQWKVGPRDVVQKAINGELDGLASHGGFDEAHIKGMADTARVTSKAGKNISLDQMKKMTVDCRSL